MIKNTTASQGISQSSTTGPGETLSSDSSKQPSSQSSSKNLIASPNTQYLNHVQESAESNIIPITQPEVQILGDMRDACDSELPLLSEHNQLENNDHLIEELKMILSEDSHNIYNLLGYHEISGRSNAEAIGFQLTTLAKVCVNDDNIVNDFRAMHLLLDATARLDPIQQLKVADTFLQSEASRDALKADLNSLNLKSMEIPEFLKLNFVHRWVDQLQPSEGIGSNFIKQLGIAQFQSSNKMRAVLKIAEVKSNNIAFNIDSLHFSLEERFAVAQKILKVQPESLSFYINRFQLSPKQTQELAHQVVIKDPGFLARQIYQNAPEPDSFGISSLTKQEQKNMAKTALEPLGLSDTQFDTVFGKLTNEATETQGTAAMSKNQSARPLANALMMADALKKVPSNALQEMLQLGKGKGKGKENEKVGLILLKHLAKEYKADILALRLNTLVDQLTDESSSKRFNDYLLALPKSFVPIALAAMPLLVNDHGHFEENIVQNLNNSYPRKFMRDNSKIETLLTTLDLLSELPLPRDVKLSLLQAVESVSTSNNTRSDIQQSLQKLNVLLKFNSNTVRTKKTAINMASFTGIHNPESLNKTITGLFCSLTGLDPQQQHTQIQDYFTSKTRDPSALLAFAESNQVNAHTDAGVRQDICTIASLLTSGESTLQEFRYRRDESNPHLSECYAINSQATLRWCGETLDEKSTSEAPKPVALANPKYPEARVMMTENGDDLLLCGNEVSGSCLATHTGQNKGLAGYILDGKNKLLVIKNADKRLAARYVVRLMIQKGFDRHSSTLALHVDTLNQNRVLNNREIKQLRQYAEGYAQWLQLPIYWVDDHKIHPALTALGGPAAYEKVDAAGQRDCPNGKFHIVSKRATI